MNTETCSLFVSHHSNGCVAVCGCDIEQGGGRGNDFVIDSLCATVTRGAWALLLDGVDVTWMLWRHIHSSILHWSVRSFHAQQQQQQNKRCVLPHLRLVRVYRKTNQKWSQILAIAYIRIQQLITIIVLYTQSKCFSLSNLVSFRCRLYALSQTWQSCDGKIKCHQWSSRQWRCQHKTQTTFCIISWP